MFGFKTKEQKIAEARAEMEELLHDFIESKGKLPKGFSAPYNRLPHYGGVIKGTPFDAYLKQISKEVDGLYDRSGVCDWFCFDGSVEINEAVSSIFDWASESLRMNELLERKCRVGKTTIFFPTSLYSGGKIMIVVSDARVLDAITEESAAKCKNLDMISFCTVTSENSFYDLFEQKEKTISYVTISYVTYPNYHDETYADWTIIDQ
jgi:hypothetical protein